MVKRKAVSTLAGYDTILSGLVDLLEGARRISARAVNAIMTASYWEVGRRIVEFEQGGKRRAEYGEALLERLSADLSAKFGRGFSLQNLYKYRQFFLTFREILPTVSGEFGFNKFPTLSGESVAGDVPALRAQLSQVAARFPLPWSHYVRLLGLRNEEARKFYETEALRCGWSVRQLDRQISTQFYERTALSRNKAAMLRKSGKQEAGDAVSPEEEIKDPAYSPDFNPIEKMWSEVKASLRSAEARTLAALQEAIAAALAKVTAQDARNWFVSCGYAIFKMLQLNYAFALGGTGWKSLA